MSEEKVVMGHNAKNGRLKDNNTASPGMAEILLPKLPNHLRMIIITIDVNNGNLQVAGPIEHEQWCIDQLVAAMMKIKEYNRELNNSENI